MLLQPIMQAGPLYYEDGISLLNVPCGNVRDVTETRVALNCIP